MLYSQQVQTKKHTKERDRERRRERERDKCGEDWPKTVTKM